MSKKFVDPPRQIRDELTAYLGQRFPEMKDAQLLVDYSDDKAGGYGAYVRFLVGTRTWPAVCEYREVGRTREYRWYCTRDWRD